MKNEPKTRREVENSIPAVGLAFLFIGIIVAFFHTIVGIAILVLGLIINLVQTLYLIYKRITGKYITITCPYCEAKDEVIPTAKAYQCFECKSMVKVKDGIGMKLE